MSCSGQAECSPPNEFAHTADLHELTANCSAPHTQKGEAQFTTTHWSVVLEAQSESPIAQEALEKLCRAYWRPIYGFVQRQGIGPEEAKITPRVFLLLRVQFPAAAQNHKWVANTRGRASPVPPARWRFTLCLQYHAPVCGGELRLPFLCVRRRTVGSQFVKVRGVCELVRG